MLHGRDLVGVQTASARAQARALLLSAEIPWAFLFLLSHCRSMAQSGTDLCLHTQSTDMAATAMAASSPAMNPVISTTSEFPGKHKEKLP